MNTLQKDIYSLLLNSKKELTVTELLQHFSKTTQPYLSRVLGQLRAAKKIQAHKVGRQVFYSIADYELGLEENLTLKNIQEDTVWQRLLENQPFANQLSERVRTILYFALSEMLNNAIDHSKSGVGYVKVWRDGKNIKFIVRDKGIGAFRNLMAKKHLPDEKTAIQELIKGRQTTAPRWHSGEGIFWTSKIADWFQLNSYHYSLTIDNIAHDYRIHQSTRSMLGTEVKFTISLKTHKSLQKLFAKYSLNHQSYSFDTTEIPVRLFDSGDVWISRSQAKRLLSNLEQYQKIILDFKGINFIGQGFADQIFRVFHDNHPEIELTAINTSPDVRKMIEHVTN